ncbi:MAG TPA: hypothetical protein VIK81_04145 [Patescibacteria group bacterium]
MTSYLRHLNDILSEAGIVLTPTNSIKIDQILHDIMGEKDEELKTAPENIIFAKIQAEIIDPNFRNWLIDEVRKRYLEKV